MDATTQTPLGATTTLTRGTASGAVELPTLGLGTWPMDDDEVERAVVEAVESGYRLVDTAENYRNEVGVGRGVRACGLPRADVFVTTKFNVEWHGRDLVARALEGSLERLGLDYVDLLLVHWPNPAVDRYVDACRGLADLLGDGRVRAVGVSNFSPAHLRRVRDEAEFVPALNQVNLSPLTTRAGHRAVHADLGVVTQAWSPLGGEGTAVLSDPTVVEVAEEAGCTPAQAVLAWCRHLGVAAVAKSASPRRMRENLASLDVVLSADQVARLTGLDRGEGAVRTDAETFGH